MSGSDQNSCCKSQMPAPGTTSRPTCLSPCRPCCTSAPHQPVGPDDLAPLFPCGELILQGSEHRARDRDPRARARFLPALCPAPLFRATGWKSPGHARQDLLQVRGREPRRQPQAQHRDPAGFLQQQAGVKAPDHRDRRGQWGTSLSFAGSCSIWRCWCSRCACRTTRSPTAAP